MRRKTTGLYIGLLALNLLAWAWALLALHDHPMLLGTALLAYGFGLRHAFDADHIVAIDNVTRKLMQEGRRPIGVGCFFALGHSTVVIVAAIVIALTASTVQQRFPGLIEAGATIGSLASIAFLFAIAFANLVVLRTVYRGFRQMRRGGFCRSQELDAALGRRGLSARVFRGVFRLVSRSWHMYPLGLLFALGFDTASEIGILGLSAAEAAKGLPIGSILVFPALFTAGMALVDATDGVLMIRAYGWALADPLRRVLYNLAITGVSVFVALAVGGIEAFGLLTEQFGSAGPIRDLAGAAGDALGVLGYAVVGLFALSWVVAIVVCRGRGIGKLSAPG